MNTRSGLCCLAVSLALVGCGSDSSGDGDDDVGIDAAPGGGPPTLTGTPGQWTWLDVPGTRCANNTATGMGVNLGTSSDLVIFMEGGGACFNAFTCASVAHPNGFGASDLDSGIGGLGNQGLFDRTDAANPLKDATFIFLPYCTGDIFAGANESGFGGRTQVGYTNVGLYTDMLVAASAPVRRVVVTGSSAGGFGALYNYDRIQKAFGNRPTFLIDDSGPPLPDQWLTPCLQSQMRQYWNLAATLPTDCAACTNAEGGGLANAIPYLADNHPSDRLGIITSTTDGVIRSFFGFGYPTCSSTNPLPADQYTAGLTALRTTVIGDRPNFKMFTISSGGHVWLFNPFSETMSGGKTLGSWITELLNGSASWDHVNP